MSRKRVDRALPRLEELFRGFDGFASGENQSRRLVEMLRVAAQAARAKEPHPFYSMREVGAFFGVSSPLVSRAYHKLEQEGLLLRLRGSMTLVQSRRMRPRVPVRAVVGIPVWLPGFTRLRDWRLLLIRLEEALRKHHFVADFVFYSHGEDAKGDFVDRLMEHQLDFLIWFTPPPLALPITQTAADHGVRNIMILTLDSSFPARRYVLSWEKALTTGLAQWRREGIRQLLLPRASLTGHTEVLGLQAALKDSRLPWSYLDMDDRNAEASLDRLLDPAQAGIILEDDLLAFRLCSDVPHATTKLIREGRLMLTRSLNFPGRIPSGLRADMARMDWDMVVRHVVDDLTTHRIFDISTPTLLQARWHPRAELNRFPEHGFL